MVSTNTQLTTHIHTQVPLYFMAVRHTVKVKPHNDTTPINTDFRPQGRSALGLNLTAVE